LESIGGRSEAANSIELLRKTKGSFEADPLTDAFARRMTYLRLSITDVCNFKCQYCLPQGYRKSNETGVANELSLTEIETLVSTFAALGTKKIRITGGEPVLRKDLVDIIHLCRNTQGIEQVALTTNGYRLMQELPDWIEAGLTQLNVSVDSINPQEFHMITGYSRLNDILQGIEVAAASSLKDIKINSVLLKDYHQNQLNLFLDWIKKRNVTLRFIELMETGEHRQFFSQQHISAEPILESLKSQGWSERKRDRHAGPAVELSHSDYVGKIGFIMPYSKNFCQSCNRIRITAQGKLHRCLFSDEGVSLRSLLKENAGKELVERIKSTIQGKAVSHSLHQHKTGAIINLSKIGG